MNIIYSLLEHKVYKNIFQYKIIPSQMYKSSVFAKIKPKNDPVIPGYPITINYVVLFFNFLLTLYWLQYNYIMYQVKQ